MSIRFIDGFDHYVSSDALLKWTIKGGSPTIGATGRFSSKGCRFVNGDSLGKTIGATGTSYILGFAFRVDAPPAEDRVIASFAAGTVNQLELSVTTSGTLKVTSAGNTLSGGVSTLALSGGTYVYIEWKVTQSTSAAASSNSVKVSGVSWLTLAASVNTSQGNANPIDSFVIGPSSGGLFNNSVQMDFDDLYVLDNTGSTNNTFIGDMRVEILLPTGAGSHTDFAHTGASSNWQAVSEAAEDGDTSYVSSATLGDIDTYAMGDLSTTPFSIAAVQAVSVTRKDDAGTRLAAAVVRTGGVDYLGASYGVPDSYAMNLTIFENNPGTGVPWTGSDVNAMEAGVKLVQ